jgi:hypothetical protein
MSLYGRLCIVIGCKREGEALPGLACLASTASLVVFMGCTPQPEQGVRGVYDEQTRELVRLDLDRDGDGRIDVRTYTIGSLPIRTEVDDDGDGDVDRWEYLDSNGRLRAVGSSSSGRADLEDTWTWIVDGNGERRVDRSRDRDRRVTRREFYRDDRLVRADEDTNGDGLPDKWEVFENGVLRHASYDTAFSTGRPDRRIVYAANGQFDHLETDPERDGTFVRAR